MRWVDVLAAAGTAVAVVWLVLWWRIDRRRRWRDASRPVWVRIRNDGRVVEFTLGCSCGESVTGMWPAEEFITSDYTPRALTCGSCHQTFNFLPMMGGPVDGP